MVTMHVRHLLVHERSRAKQPVIYESPVFRFIEVVCYGRLAQSHWLAVFVSEILGVKKLTGLGIVNIKLAG